jgi:uncharacterized protein YijF (DUF1287 family)
MPAAVGFCVVRKIVSPVFRQAERIQDPIWMSDVSSIERLEGFLVTQRFMVMRLLSLSLFALSALSANAAPKDDFLASAAAQIGRTVSYDPAYTALAYPGGDVPISTGVCTDVLVRAFRQIGVDLQKDVHEDMKKSFAAYPHLWNLRSPDTNIDHRRVPNLMAFFKRLGKAVPVTREAADYRPADIVAWRLPDGRPHIGIVSAEPSEQQPDRFKIIHNIGAGARSEDRLFDFEIIGHYRYF